MVGFDDIAFRITKQGSDERNLGRWTWYAITGKYNINTTIVTCYRPWKAHQRDSYTHNS